MTGLATTAEGTTFLDVRGHFLKQVANYDRGCEKVKWSGPQALIERLALLRTLEDPGLKVLDLGTGTALVAQILKQRNPDTHITGVDFVPEMIEAARRKGVLDVGIEADINELDRLALPRREFNIVTASGVLDFVSNTEILADEITGVLKPGGLFAFTYEPVGNPHPGVNTFKHDSERLKDLFRQRGAQIIFDEPINAWINYKTQDSVTNNVLVGQAYDI